jgi:hypothetical protein
LANPQVLRESLKPIVTFLLPYRLIDGVQDPFGRVERAFCQLSILVGFRVLQNLFDE